MLLEDRANMLNFQDASYGEKYGAAYVAAMNTDLSKTWGPVGRHRGERLGTIPSPTRSLDGSSIASLGDLLEEQVLRALSFGESSGIESERERRGERGSQKCIARAALQKFEEEEPHRDPDLDLVDHELAVLAERLEALLDEPSEGG